MIVALGRTAAGTVDVDASLPLKSPAPSKLDVLVHDMPWPAGLAARMLVATRAATDSGPQDQALDAPPLPGDGRRSYSLPRPRTLPGSSRTLTDIIVSRRSGGLGGGTLGEVELATLLATTAAPLPMSLLPHRSLAPVIFPLVVDVENLPPAVFRYVPADHALLPVQAIDRDAIRDRLLLQRDHGDCPAIIFIVVPMAQWLHRFGDRGYRGAAMHAGYLSDRLYLAAEALELTYTASGGFAPARADEFLALDGYHHTAIFSFVVGARRRRRLVADS
jgi:SagB-type dehydrogenase family enzyme